MSAGGQCVSELFQLHDSIVSHGVLLTLVILWEEGREGGPVLTQESLAFRLHWWLLTDVSDTAVFGF